MGLAKTGLFKGVVFLEDVIGNFGSSIMVVLIEHDPKIGWWQNSQQFVKSVKCCHLVNEVNIHRHMGTYLKVSVWVRI